VFLNIYHVQENGRIQFVGMDFDPHVDAKRRADISDLLDRCGLEQGEYVQYSFNKIPEEVAQELEEVSELE